MAEDPRIFEPAYYERLHDIEADHWWSRGMRAAMEALLARPARRAAPRRVLDVGCGTGYLLGRLAEAYDPAGAACGIDLSIHGLAWCRDRGAHRLAAAGAATLPFADGSFDLVTCIDTLQHLCPEAAVDDALREMARVTAPGGLVYLRTNSAWGHRRLVGADPDRYRRFRRAALVRRVELGGLAVLQATYVNALPSLWAVLREIVGGERRVPATGPGLHLEPPALKRRWLDRILLAVLRLESGWLRAGGRLPFGHSVAVVARRESGA